MGINKIKATSKKTGIEMINPVKPNASGDLLFPALLIRYRAMESAPPEFSKIAPNIAPKPTIVATKPNVDPMPSCTVSIIFGTDNPAKIPVTMEAINKAINAGNLKYKTNISKLAIPANTLYINK